MTAAPVSCFWFIITVLQQDINLVNVLLMLYTG